MIEKATEYLSLAKAKKMINRVARIQTENEEPINPAFLFNQLIETGYIAFAFTSDNPIRYHDIECIKQIDGCIKVVYDTEW